MMEELENKKKKKKMLIISSIVFTLIILMGSVYAFFTYSRSLQAFTLTTNGITVLFTEKTNQVDFTGAYPISDQFAKDNLVDLTYIDFSVSGSVENVDEAITYEIYLTENDGNTLDPRYVKLYLTDESGNTVLSPRIYSSLGNTSYSKDSSIGKVIYKDTKAGSFNQSYRLYVWLDQEYSDNTISKKFSFKVNLYAYNDSSEGINLARFDYIPELNNFLISINNENSKSSTTDEIILKVSSPDERIKFNYSYAIQEDDDSETIVEDTNQSSINLTLNIPPNEVRNINLSVKGTTFAGNDLIFEVIKNGKTMQKFEKTVYRSSNDINIMGSLPSSITDNKTSITKVEFKNVAQATLEENYPIILTYSDEGELRGDVRAKLDDGTLTIASDGKTYLNTASELFYGYTNLVEIDFANIDTSLIDSFFRFLANCSNLTTIRNIDKISTSNATNLTSMFLNCNKLTSLDVSHFDTSKVTVMQSMFNKCSSLTSLDLSNFDTSKVINMKNMFNHCEGLTTLNLSSFNTSKVTNMENMFYHCEGLTTLNLSNFNTSKVTNMSGMFNSCFALTTANSNNTTGLIGIENFNVSKLRDASNMFRSASSLTSLDLSNWKTTSKLENMASMFREATSLTSVNMSGLNTSGVLNMEYLFYKCSSLVSANLSNLNATNVTNLQYLFRECGNLTNLNLSGFKTSNKLEYLYTTFRDCTSLESVDLSGFDPSGATDIRYLFYNCTSLKTVYVSNLWSLKNDVLATGIFTNCTQIKGGNGTTFVNNTVTYARLDDPENEQPGYFTYRDAPR